MSKPKKPLGKVGTLRTFRAWPIEQVMEVMRTLYETAPFQSDAGWKMLARRAYDFLDQSHAACVAIDKERSATDDTYRLADKQRLSAETLPEQVPFEQAAKFITNEDRKDRALPKLKKLVLSKPRYFGTASKAANVNAQLRRWQNSGMSRSEALELRAVFEASWPGIVAKQNSAKKRRPRLNAKDVPVMRALLSEIHKA
ncbi:MAG: hypothetical protein M3Q86_11650 [Verrucomicrobiota bacterium]|nr:hypothetical protein [Verrucomicrobiota bacterium]